ncbi:GDSL-type esterase/lipase family protein [Planctomycetota bacterium]
MTAAANRAPGGRETWAIRLFLTVLTALALGSAFPGDVEGESRWARHYRERVEAFRRENAALPGGKKHMVFLGDSITEGFPLKSNFSGWSTLNRGISADRIGCVTERGVLHRLKESVYDTNPAAVFLLIGVNDLASSGRPTAVWIEGIATIVARIREHCPKTPIVLQTLLPVGRAYGRHATLNPRILALNSEIRGLAKKTPRVGLLDLHALYSDKEGFLPDDLTRDGLHLKKGAYSRWAEAAKALFVTVQRVEVEETDPRTNMYRIDLWPEAIDNLKALKRFDATKIADAMEAQLKHEPTKATKKRKRLRNQENLAPPWEHAKPIWEIKVDEWRVFYDVDEEAKTVRIRAIREKPSHKTTEEIW